MQCHAGKQGRARVRALARAPLQNQRRPGRSLRSPTGTEHLDEEPVHAEGLGRAGSCAPPDSPAAAGPAGRPRTACSAPRLPWVPTRCPELAAAGHLSTMAAAGGRRSQRARKWKCTHRYVPGVRNAQSMYLLHITYNMYGMKMYVYICNVQYIQFDIYSIYNMFKIYVYIHKFIIHM